MNVVVEESRTDAALMAAANRAPALFGVVFDRHFETIHRYLDRRAGRNVADELSGEVFRVAFEQRHRFMPVHESALPWLYGLATNLLLKHWRRGARETRALQRVGFEGDGQQVESAAAEARLDAQLLGKRLGQALGRLQQGDRDVVLLTAWEELSCEEVAAALGIPEGTVRSRLNRARRLLRASIADEAEPAGCGLATGKDAR